MPPSKRKRTKAPQGKGLAPTPTAPPPAPTRRLLPPVLDAWIGRIPYFARRRMPRISRAEALAAVPVRNELIEWTVRPATPDDDAAPEVVVLRIPRRQDRWGRLLNRFFEGPSHREVILDELGTDVWELCDGRTSVDGVVRALVKKHKLDRREVELSLTTYLQTLAKRGFIGLRLEPQPGATGPESGHPVEKE